MCSHLKANCCLKVHNVPLKLASPILGQTEDGSQIYFLINHKRIQQNEIFTARDEVGARLYFHRRV